MTNFSKRTNIMIAFGLIYFIWGTTYLAMRIGLETIPPMFLGAIRFLIAGVGTYAVLRFSGVSNPTIPQWRSAAIAGTLLFIGGNGLVMLAMRQGLPSGIAAVIVATMPIWMTLFDWLFYKSTRPTVVTVIGLIFGFIGIVLLIDPFKSFLDPSQLNFSACLLCLMAPIFWSIGSLQARGMDLPKNVFMSVALQMIWGGVAFAMISFAFGEWTSAEWSTPSLRSMLSVLYLIVFGSIVAITTYMWLLQNAPASRVSTYTYVNPIIAVFLGWLVLNEQITLKMWIAIGVILTSVVLIVSSQSRKRTNPKSELNNESNAETVSLAKRQKAQSFQKTKNLKNIDANP